MREGIVRPLGLVTQPNKLGQFPAGALSQASGLVMRSPGLLTKAPQLVSYVSAVWLAAPTTPALLFPLPTTMVALGLGNTAKWDLEFASVATLVGNQVDAILPLSPWTFDSTGRVFATVSRGRLLINGDKGITINDTVAPTTNALALPRMAGIAQIMVQPAASTAGTVAALAAGQVCATIAIIRRKSSDGYETLSPPTAPMVIGNAAACNISFQASWNTFNNLAYNAPLAGDIIEFYRTLSQPNGSPVGNVYRLSMSYPLSTAEVAAGTVTVTDTTPDAALGREAYFNPGQTTPLSIKLAPPLARCMCTFKGYTFYGNYTGAAAISLTVPGSVSIDLPASSPSTRLNGIGTRQLTATFTNTSNVLTAIAAADMVGLAVGQTLLDAALVTGGATVTAVGATTLTLSQNANANVTKVTNTFDAMLLDGNNIVPQYWRVMVGNASGFAFYASECVPPLLAPTNYSDSYAPREFTIIKNRAGSGSFTIAASNPQNYAPRLPATTATPLTVNTNVVPNGVMWSELNQPEAVPLVNNGFTGSGELYAMHPTRDCIWVFASDGLWRISGTGGAAGTASGFDWRLNDLVDSTLSLSAPHAACVLRDTVYAYTNRGLVSVDSNGNVVELSQGVINDLLPGPPWSLTANIQITADETNDEIWLLIVSAGVTTIYVFNTLTGAWTTILGSSGGTADKVLAYSRLLQGVITAPATGTTIYSPSPTLFQPETFDYQPVFGEDPFLEKQWQSATLVCAAADAGKSVTPRFNGVAYTAAALIAQQNDARATYDIGRAVPARANSIAPGFSGSDTASLTIHGISLASEVIGDQRRQR